MIGEGREARLTPSIGHSLSLQLPPWVPLSGSCLSHLTRVWLGWVPRSLCSLVSSLAGRVRSGKATEVSRTRRYAERRGRMRRVQEPTRRSQTRAWGERNNILAYQVPLGISFFIYLMPWVFILYLMLRSFPRLRRPLPTLTPLDRAYGV